MAFNVKNYRRLMRSFARKLKTGAAIQFNYGTGSFRGANDGCIACECRRLSGVKPTKDTHAEYSHIATFLGVSRGEACDIYVGFSPGHMFGSDGLRAAIANLRKVAKAHGVSRP